MGDIGAPGARRRPALRVASALLAAATLLCLVSASGSQAPRVLFGLGPEADGALASSLVADGRIGMLTSWFTGTADLAWMTPWRHDLVPQAYADGFAHHVIVFGYGPYVEMDTEFGRACGSPYPLSDGFLDDMRDLAETFAGDVDGPPVYVTMFTEFQTYPCLDNGWYASPEATAYYRALQRVYLDAVDIWHETAPNSKVSLGWGGWQARWDDPANGAGRSLFEHFDEVLRRSDFQSFQAMESDTNVADVVAMTEALGRYGPVMLAHYRPDNGDQRVFDDDMRVMLTDSYLSPLVANGLFAVSFMDARLLESSVDRRRVEDALTQFGGGRVS